MAIQQAALGHLLIKLRLGVSTTENANYNPSFYNQVDEADFKRFTLSE
jgi:hypothetical protein